MADLDIEKIPALEASVEAQCAKGTYDLDENLLLLKLYQFFPEKANPAVVARVLVKALMQLPETDFLLCTYLIPERIASEAPVLPIVELSGRLETCQFQAFWEELAASRELVKAAPGFDDAIRECASPACGPPGIARPLPRVPTWASVVASAACAGAMDSACPSASPISAPRCALRSVAKRHRARAAPPPCSTPSAPHRPASPRRHFGHGEPDLPGDRRQIPRRDS